MNSRTAALILTILGAGLLFFLASGEAASAPGLMAGLIGIAAIWLASGKTRFVLAAISGLLWLAALVLAVFGSAAAVVGAIIGLAGSVLALAKGSQWPGFSSRYARASDLEDDGLISPRQMWESLDRGLDPTRKRDDD
ncbi:MAG TPA: Trp biosynthesis-associated membrane protein [Candidatus Nanopelagicales bacterium]|nr:Trp biosynthesis-associated membrane protein [Candidatus Nanopelagicales bacterium]